MKRFFAAVVAALALSIASAGAAGAHSAPPCNDSGEPGNSDYAQHHIVPLAQDGALGHDGHVPGSHQGFSVCLAD
jgi:hypothetical protein